MHGWWWHLLNDPMRTNPWSIILVIGTVATVVALYWWRPSWTHVYYSTHCRHKRHKACAATELAPGIARRPAQCKTCAAPCICWCHWRHWGRRR